MGDGDAARRPEVVGRWNGVLACGVVERREPGVYGWTIYDAGTGDVLVGGTRETLTAAERRRARAAERVRIREVKMAKIPPDILDAVAALDDATQKKLLALLKTGR